MTNHAQQPVLPLLSTESPDAIEQTLQRLRHALPDTTIGVPADFSTAELARVDVAIAANPSRPMLDQLPNLRWLQSLWAGVENLLEHARQRDFEVVRLVDPALAVSMAEAALAWTLYLHRRMPEYARQQRTQHWQALPWKHASDTHVCVLGLGELGSACAARLVANGFNVSGWSTSAKVLPGVRCHHGANALPQALQQANIVLVLLPHTAATDGLINTTVLQLLPPQAALINFARGAVVATTDLLAALGSGQLAHAVLDVFNEEPLPADSPLWLHPNITVLPHIAAPTDPQSAVAIVAKHVDAYHRGGIIPKSVDLRKGF